MVRLVANSQAIALLLIALSALKFVRGFKADKAHELIAWLKWDKNCWVQCGVLVVLLAFYIKADVLCVAVP